MGLDNRDYAQYGQTPYDRVESPRSVTITLIVITVVVFVVQMMFIVDARDAITGNTGSVNQVTDLAAVSKDSLLKPWLCWQVLTYGFLHDHNGIFHILFNMIGLFCFGRVLEQRLGQMEFLRFYLVAIVIGGLAAAIGNLIGSLFLGQGLVQTVGASGAVVATVILFACYYPDQEIYLLVFPVKAKIVAALHVLINLAGALGLMNAMGRSDVAFTVHLVGAGFAFAYFFRRWNLGWLASMGAWPNMLRQRARRAKLKIHDPDRQAAHEAQQADEILAKIHRLGESSLTSKERKLLERYSRRQRQRRDS